VRTIDPTYSRTTSRVLVREVKRPTRANLDYAAYVGNNILHRAEGPPEELPGAVIDRARLFGGFVRPETIVASLASTPLDARERARPLAFVPLVDYLAQWSDSQARGLEEARAAVREETWGLRKAAGRSYQQITTLYLHRPRGGAPQLWAKIEFEPTPRLFPSMPDEDGDGYPEIYGALRPGLASDAALRRIEQDYRGRVLSAAELRSWAHELASYWYPTYNTDLVDLYGASAWPLPSTESDIVAALRGRLIARPTIVVRGKPQGQALYNVFVVPGHAPVGKAPVGAATRPAAAPARLKAAAVSPRTEELRRALRDELRREGGGSFTTWAERVRPLHEQIALELRRRPKELRALVGRDGFLFYRSSLEYVVGGDLRAQAAGKNPFSAIVGFQRYLARLGVDFLLVPVPTKAEVYPDKLLAPKLLEGKLPRLNPFGRKLLLELAEAGVEVIDLLPSYLAARVEDARSEELLYQPQDTHWTDRGLRLAAERIAQRVKQYPWYTTLAEESVTLGERRVRFKQLGDLHSRLAPREQRRYRAATLIGRQVTRADGTLYEDDASSPIVLLGDSFTGVYQLMGCTHAGVSAHIARLIRYPLDLVMSYGGGPNVRRQLLSRGEPALRRKRLLIWLFAARDLYNYWEDWAAVEASSSRRK
jgi:alginate O-acetyltransferase complex protein AlgJ